MSPDDARALLHRAAIAYPDAAVVLVGRLLAMGEPGSPDVLGPANMVQDDGVPEWDRGVREQPGSDGWLRGHAAALWRMLGMAGR